MVNERDAICATESDRVVGFNAITLGQRLIPPSCSLLRKADFLQQLLKAGVGAQRIEFQIH